MFTSRYSEIEMNQWQAACASEKCSSHDAPRQNRARALMAKGQAEKKQSRTATATMQTQTPKQDDWASECLFDCYNG
jgi:hypothetical protein